MRRRFATIAASAAAALFLGAGVARGARQVVALFPPENLSGAATAPYVPLIAPALAAGLSDRFEVQAARAEGPADPSSLRRQARILGAAYAVTGSLSRIGKTVTLDLEIAPTEEPGRGRTVVVTAVDSGKKADGDLPLAYRKLVIEAAAKLKYLFFGDEVVGRGPGRRKIPKPAGAVVRSRPLPGDMVSAAYGDADGDGRSEVVAAYPDSIAVYALSGDDLVEKARIPGAGSGYVRVDVARVGRKGVADIVATRCQDGKVGSDLFEYDGAGYRAVATGLPYFLRAVSMGAEGMVLVGQDADPVGVFAGPVFRVAPELAGAGGAARGAPLPLPAGTWLYDFLPVRRGQALRFVVLGEKGRLRLLDGDGRNLWESLDALSAADTAVEAAVARPGTAYAQRGKRFLPPRLLAVDLDGDGTDEVVVLNDLSTAGWFFEGVLIHTNAEALAFAQDDDALQLVWRTPLVGGSAADAFAATAPDGKPGRIGVASRRGGRVLAGLGEWNVLWLK